MYKRYIELFLISTLILILQFLLFFLFTQTWGFLRIFLTIINIGFYLLGIHLIKFSIAKNYIHKLISTWIIVFSSIVCIFDFNDLYLFFQHHSYVIHQVFNYSISISFGLLSVYVAVHISNLHRKNLYSDIFGYLKQLEYHLKSYKELPKLLEEYDQEDYLLNLGYSGKNQNYSLTDLKKQFEIRYRKVHKRGFNEYWDKFYDRLREVNGKIKELPEYLDYHEKFYFPTFEEESKETISGRVESVARHLDFLLDENNIFGFSRLMYNPGTIFSIKYKRSLLGVITGMTILPDKRNVPKKIISGSKVRYGDLKRKSIEDPTNQKLKKQLLKKYKKNIKIFHYDKKRKKHVKQ